MNYAVLVDLNSMRLSYDSFVKAMDKIDGKIAYAKLYGYNNKRNNDFNNFIKTYGVEVALPVSNRKKIRVDIRQVIDAVTIACTYKNVDAFFIICSELDSIAMINALKKLGKRVVMGIQSPSFVAEQCDSYIIMERVAPSNVDEHEDEDRGDALQGRDEDRAEKARGLGEFGRSEAENAAENETYENLLDEGCLQKRHGKAEDFA